MLELLPSTGELIYPLLPFLIAGLVIVGVGIFLLKKRSSHKDDSSSKPSHMSK